MKAPTSHLFVDDGDHVDGRHSYWNPSPTKKEQNVADLLKWISDVTIKRRKFRRATRCSNLLAEAVLSSSLRQARQDLAIKQEEKRKKAHEFSYQLTIKCMKTEKEESNQLAKANSKYHYNSQHEYQHNNCKNDYYRSTSQSSDNDNYKNCISEASSGDEDVKACISSLDNFFSELKSIKV